MGKEMAANYYARLIKKNIGYTLDDVPADIIDKVKEKINELPDNGLTDSDPPVTE